MPRWRLKLVFAGTTTNAVEMLRYLHEQQRHEIVAVLTREDAPVGRKKILTPSPVAEYALAQGMAVIKANRVDATIDERLAQTKFEIGLVIAYGAILKPSTLSLPALGWFNIHFSMLPKWRGAAPVQRSILAGEQDTGITIFRLDEGMDTGDIVCQVPSIIEADDNTTTLLDRLTRVAVSALDETLAKIESGIVTFSEQVGEPSHAAKFTRDDVRINWSATNREIDQLIRAANPEPMAWTTLDEQAFRIIEAKPANLDSFAVAGSVQLIDSKVYVSCGSGCLELLEVQPASKNPMKANDWLRGKNGAVLLK